MYSILEYNAFSFDETLHSFVVCDIQLPEAHWVIFALNKIEQLMNFLLRLQDDA